MVQRRQNGNSAASGDGRTTLPEREPIRVAIPALDADERNMLREIALRIRRLETRNTVVEHTLRDIAEAVERSAGGGAD